jgi:hypothetical protein
MPMAAMAVIDTAATTTSRPSRRFTGVDRSIAHHGW